MERTSESRREAAAKAAGERTSQAAGPALADLRPASAAQANLQRMIETGPRMTAQRKATSGAGAAASEKSDDSGLPRGLRAGVEELSGVAMDGVKVHYNSDKPAGVGALAYAQGRDIHLASGQEHHLPHEAWHVAQQAQGRVQPTMQTKPGVPINDDKSLEQEADVMGARAAQRATAQRMADGDA